MDESGSELPSAGEQAFEFGEMVRICEGLELPFSPASVSSAVLVVGEEEWRLEKKGVRVMVAARLSTTAGAIWVVGSGVGRARSLRGLWVLGFCCWVLGLVPK